MTWVRSEERHSQQAETPHLSQEVHLRTPGNEVSPKSVDQPNKQTANQNNLQ